MRGGPDFFYNPGMTSASVNHTGAGGAEGARPETVKLPKSVRITFIRHGQAAVEEDPDDPPLTTLGRLQARRIGERMAGMTYAHLYCSDLRRARDTAAQIARHHPETPRTVTPDLNETSHEHWALPAAAIKPAHRPHLEQEIDALQRFINHVHHHHRHGEHLIVVAHGNLIRTLIPLMAGREPYACVPMEIYHTAVSVVQMSLGGPTCALLLANCTAHLQRGEVTL